MVPQIRTRPKLLNLIEELKELTQLKSFIGHLGRPGKRGGSLPKGATAAPAAPSAPVQEIIWGKVSLGKSSTRKGAFRLVADMFGSDWYEKGYRIWKWQDEQHIVKVNPRKRKAAAAIEPVADKPKSEFFEGDFGSSTIKQIYNNSSERVKRLADQTGLLACDEIAYSYIKDELKQDARSLVNVADLQYGFSGTYGYYGSKMKFLDNWRTSGSPGNQYFRSHDKWDIDLLQNFAHAGKIPNKDYLRGPELQSLTELGDKYNFPKPDAYISRYDLASEDVDALKQLAMRAWWRAAFVKIGRAHV